MIDYEVVNLPDVVMMIFYCIWAYYYSFKLSSLSRFFLKLFVIISIIHFVVTFIYIPNGIDSRKYFRLAFAMSVSSTEPPIGQGKVFICYLTYFLIRFLGLSYTGCHFFFSILGLTGYYLIINTIVFLIKKYKLYSNKNIFYLLLLPGLHWWTVALGKDSLIFFSIALFFSGIVQRRIPFIIIGGTIIGFIRSPVLIIFLVSLTLGYIFFNKKVTLRQKTLILLVSGIMVIVLLPAVLDRLQLETVSYEEIDQSIETGLTRNQGRGSSVNMQGENIIIKLCAFLFRPLFFDAHNLLTLASSFENVIWIFMVGMVLINVTSKMFKVNYSGLFVMLLLSFILPSAAQSTGLSNLGIAVRMKTMYFMPLILLVFLSYDYRFRSILNKKKRNKVIYLRRRLKYQN